MQKGNKQTLLIGGGASGDYVHRGGGVTESIDGLKTFTEDLSIGVGFLTPKLRLGDSGYLRGDTGDIQIASNFTGKQLLIKDTVGNDKVTIDFDTGYVSFDGNISGANLSGTNTGDQTATTVSNTPTGNIASTTVQGAINELDDEKFSRYLVNEANTQSTITYNSGFSAVLTQQGVISDGTYIYAISADLCIKFDKTGTEITRRTITTDVPSQAHKGDGCYYSGILYIGSGYNASGEVGAILKLNASDLSVNGYVMTHGGHDASAVARKSDGTFWVTAYNNPTAPQIHKYDSSLTYVASYDLESVDTTYVYDGLEWDGDYLLANIHEGVTGKELIYKYYFDGVEFFLVETISHLFNGQQCGQGMSFDPVETGILWFCSRNNNKIIRTTYTSNLQSFNANVAKLTGGNSFSGDQTFDTNTFFIDSVNNRVGVGNVAPTQILHASGSSNPTVRVQNTGTGEARIDLDSSATGTRIFYRDSDKSFGLYDGAGTFLRYFNSSSGALPRTMSITDISTSQNVASAVLTVQSITKGILFPKMTTAQKNAITSPATGLFLFDTDLNRFQFYNGLSWVDDSNATHTGDVTGATALTIDKTAITGKTAVTAVGTDYVLISDTSDSGNIKKALVSDLVTDGDKGDVTVSSSGTVWTIDEPALRKSETSINNQPLFYTLNKFDTLQTNFYGNGTVALESTLQAEGTGCMKLTLSTAGNCGPRVAFTTPVNFYQKAMTIKCRASAWADITTAEILFGTDSSFSNYYLFQWKGSSNGKLVTPPDNEWIERIFNPGDCMVGAGTPNWGSISHVIIRAIAGTGTPDLYVDDFKYFEANQKPMVCVTFDDSLATQFSNGKAKLDQYDIKATFYTIWDLVGTVTYMTQANLDTLSTQGHDISGHGQTNLTTISSAHQITDLIGMKKFLVTNGYRGSNNYALPNGAYTDAVLANVRKYFNSIANIDWLSNTKEYSPNYLINRFSPDSSTSTATIQAWIDNAIANNNMAIIAWHGIVAAAPTGAQVLQSTYDTIMDYIGTKKNNGDIDTGTLTDYYATAPTPIDNYGAAEMVAAGIYL